MIAIVSAQPVLNHFFAWGTHLKLFFYFQNIQTTVKNVFMKHSIMHNITVISTKECFHSVCQDI